ncbi:N-terminal acetyltransferase B complex subunit arm1 [Neolecta irregularis DAH-3]|uniref:N-terminal acetyltransferase B complex subunit arm1 n=1 Tax=Neolecta irregularis (strain DAH-3) TaxID=1198029 RepID=A0A1U7LU15_NEOID|nr:N-terminal acetyltransferase B complex subunit arm1 [Neolecta irregularis DAH-3]|eukprot:OLL26166.1 N-terminal acetyltransferase B complex subunit arm1 [Neolecta irregularis DAH-3]
MGWNEDVARSQPIHEAIQLGHHRQALQLCTKALKRTPQSLLLRTLKALTLTKLGRKDEAWQVCQEVIAQVPTDFEALNVLHMLMENIGKGNEAVVMYDNALKKSPKDETLAHHFFLTMVQTGNIKAQQRVAMHLQKTFNRQEYYQYAVQSLHLLHKQEPSSIYGTLACRMIEKAIQQNTETFTCEQVHLYVTILAFHKRYQQAADVLEKFLPLENSEDIEFLRLKLSILDEMADWTTLYSLCISLIDNGKDDWRVYQLAIKTFVSLFLDAKKEPNELGELLSYFKRKDSRNADLASISLTFKRLNSDLASASLNACVEYFNKYCKKPSCFEDLEPYVRMLSFDERTQFLQSIQVSLEENAKLSVDLITSEINIQKLSFLINSSQRQTINESFVKTNIDLYARGLHVGQAREKIDNSCSDDALLLACHALLLVNSLELHTSIIQAITLLDFGLKHSPCNYQFKFLLIRLYIMLGAFPQAISVYKSLNIKQIQCDTLNHLVFTRIASVYPSETVTSLLKESCSIYGANAEETPEAICRAYESGAWSKIEDFTKLRQRLEASLWKAMTGIELGRLAFFQNGHNYDFQYNFGGLESSFSDNRDFKILRNCIWSKDDYIECCTRLQPLPMSSWFILQKTLYDLRSVLLKGDFLEVHRVTERLKECFTAATQELSPHEASFFTKLISLLEYCKNGNTSNLCIGNITWKDKCDGRSVEELCLHLELILFKLLICATREFSLDNRNGKAAPSLVIHTLNEEVKRDLKGLNLTLNWAKENIGNRSLDQCLEQLDDLFITQILERLREVQLEVLNCISDHVERFGRNFCI